MAKVLILTDTHWGVRNDSPVFLEYFKKTMDEFVLPFIEENNIKYVIHGGDLVDRRKYININTANRLRTDFLEKLEGRGIHTWIIAGNHDEYYKDTHRVNALDELLAGRYEDISIVTEPTTITIDDCEFFLLPWITKETEKISEEAIKNSKAPICVGHLDLQGFEELKGHISDHGWNHRVFGVFDLVVTGHYHHRSSRDNIHYIGALCEHTWSDYNDPRGFVVFDTESRVLDFHRNPFSVFHMVAYDDVKYPDIIERISLTDYSKYKDCYVKVVCVNKTNPYALDRLLEELYKVQPADISIIEDVSSFLDNNADELVDEAQDTLSILRSYVSGLTLPVNPDKMIDYLNGIYIEAVSLENVE